MFVISFSFWHFKYLIKYFNSFLWTFQHHTAHKSYKLYIFIATYVLNVYLFLCMCICLKTSGKPGKECKQQNLRGNNLMGRTKFSDLL